MAMGKGMDTSMDMGMDTSTRRIPELLHAAGEGAVGPGCGYGVRLWVGGQSGGRDGWGKRMWTPGGHDSHKQSGDQGQAGGMAVRQG